jgi:predicted  nucleic acid-binding Zn-ribbon protein
MYTKKQYPNFIVEIDWDLDRSAHGDDHISVFPIGDRYIFVIVADGVTGCTSGRVASVFLSKYIQECLESSKELKDSFFRQREILLEKVIEEALNCAVDKLKKLNSKVISLKDLFSLRKELKQIMEEIEKLQKSIDGVYEPVETFREKILTKVTEFVKRLNASQFFQIHSSRVINLQGEVRMLSQNISSFINYYQKMPSQLKSLTNNFNELWKELENKLEIPKFENTIKSSIIQGQEDAEKVYADIVEKIIQSDPSKIHFDTTLALLAIEEINLPLGPCIKITAIGYGDTEINIVRETTMETFIKNPSERILSSYISSREGTQGPRSFRSVNIREESTIIVSSDGANVWRATPGGYHGMIFSNKLNQWIRQKSSIEGFSKSWIGYLKTENALLDDASLAVIRILPKPGARAQGGRASLF